MMQLNLKHIISNPYHEILRFDLGKASFRKYWILQKSKVLKRHGFRRLAPRKRLSSAFTALKEKVSEKDFGEPMAPVRNKTSRTPAEPPRRAIRTSRGIELLEASGTLAIMGGKPAPHIPRIFGGGNYKTIGGHIHRLIRGYHIHPWEL